jgi:magnesium chelatase subunit ChlD-like protein
LACKKSLSHRGNRPASKAGLPRWRAKVLSVPTGATQRLSAGRSDGAIAWLRTLLAKGPQALQRAHLRHQPLAARAPRLHLIALDTSGSMRRDGRLAAAKGHAALLIEQAAGSNDDVALLSFGGAGVELLLVPGPARRSGAARVRPLGGGGGTPLASALAEAERLLRRSRVQHRSQGACETWLWLLTDGRSLEQPVAPGAAEHIVIIDFDAPAGAPGTGIGRCAAWAAEWGAEHRHASLPAP